MMRISPPAARTRGVDVVVFGIRIPLPRSVPSRLPVAPGSTKRRPSGGRLDQPLLDYLSEGDAVVRIAPKKLTLS
jgi:hypothetical protein